MDSPAYLYSREVSPSWRSVHSARRSVFSRPDGGPAARRLRGRLDVENCATIIDTFKFIKIWYDTQFSNVLVLMLGSPFLDPVSYPQHRFSSQLINLYLHFQI